VIVQEVRSLPAGQGYDALRGEFGDMISKGIIDPAKVTRSALENAVSIASMVLTTNCLVTDIPEKRNGNGGGAPPPMY
jgi:chaperonin GroEL